MAALAWTDGNEPPEVGRLSSRAAGELDRGVLAEWTARRR
jgi:hypothetical protein